MRVYQTPNVLQVLEGTVTVSTLAAPLTNAESAQNLIENLSWRTAGGKRRFSGGVEDSSESCYRTGKSELTASNFIFAVEFDLKNSYF